MTEQVAINEDMHGKQAAHKLLTALETEKAQNILRTVNFCDSGAVCSEAKEVCKSLYCLFLVLKNCEPSPQKIRRLIGNHVICI